MAQQIDLLKNTSFEGKMDSLIEAILKGENYDYAQLTNKPSINGYTLEGNKTNAQLGIPTKTSDITNDSGFVEDKNYVHTDENFTSAEKTKLGGISDGAEANVQANWSETDPMEDSFIKNKPIIPSKTSDLTNDSNYVVDSDYKHTDNNYTTADKNSVATIGNKVDKVEGKGLSTNDLTDTLKANYDDAYTKAHEHSNKAVLDATTASFTLDDQTKLINIESGAQKNTITGVKGSAEEDYRDGNVNITKTNIGLGNVANERQWSATNHPTTMSGYGITDGVNSTDYNTLKGRVDTNEDNIAMLDSDVEGLTTDVGTLKTDMTTVKGAVTTIQGDYVPKTRKVNGKALNADITLAASDVKAIPTSQKGTANGVAELDANGLVPSSQLPSYVDDVLEYDTKTDFPTNGESGKIYIATDTNLQYRWTGTQYVEISSSLALGETSSTAYRGDRGKIAYDHSQKTSGNPHKVTKNDVGLSNVPNVATNDQTPTFTKADSRDLPISGETLSTLFGKILKWFSDLKSVAFSGDYTDLSNQPTNATTSTNGLMSKDDKLIVDRLNRESLSLVPRGTAITANQNLNTVNFIMVGKYHCSTNAIVQTLTNCPTTEAFMMEVFSPLSTAYDNETTSQWVYRLRRITTLNGHIYTQVVSSGSTAGTFAYGTWYKMYSELDKPVDTWIAFKGATATSNGTAGYVPAPTMGNQDKFFRADGTWATLSLTWNE